MRWNNVIPVQDRFPRKEQQKNGKQFRARKAKRQERQQQYNQVRRFVEKLKVPRRAKREMVSRRAKEIFC